ncbi:anti-sigma-F factor Fin [Pradoshia sp.]
MALHYYCRHCGHVLGNLEERHKEQYQSVLEVLTAEEREEIINYDDNGILQIRSICESCQEALENQPDYHLLDYLIQ